MPLEPFDSKTTRIMSTVTLPRPPTALMPLPALKATKLSAMATLIAPKPPVPSARRPPPELLSSTDVSVFCRRSGWAHAEEDDSIVLRRFACPAAGFGKCAGISDNMIGGKRHDNGIAVAPRCKCGAGEGRGPRIAPHRFEKNIGLHRHSHELLSNDETILCIGDDDRTTKQCRVGNPAKSLLKRRILTKQRQKLLGSILARRRPQPRPGTTTHDEGNDWSRQFLLRHVWLIPEPVTHKLTYYGI